MDYIDDETTDAAVVSKLTLLADSNLAAQIIKTDDGRTFGVRRNDVVFDQLTPANAAEVYAPKIISLTTQLQTSTALSKYLHRFKDEDSIMFADVLASKVTAIVDYHVRPETTDAATAKGAIPRHSAHRAILQLRHSQEWHTWVSQDGKLMSHLAFANFLEENGIDITQPSGGALLEICKDLNVKGDADFKSSVRQGDVVSIEYRKSDNVSTAGNIELPAEIMIAIPVYFGEPAITMNVLLRRKVEDGKLFLGFKIKRLENHKQDEFLRIVDEVSVNTSVEAVLGNPA